jgi:chaperonin GroEL
MKEKKARVEDALSRHQARRWKKGSFLEAAQPISVASRPLDGSRGYLRRSTKGRTRIVRRSLEEPIRQIASNAGAEASVVVGKVREG